MSGAPPKKSYEDGGHSSSSRYPLEDTGTYPKLTSSGVSNEYHHPPYDVGQDARTVKIPRSESRDIERRSPLHSGYRMLTSSLNDSHTDSHPTPPGSRLESRDSKDNQRIETRESSGEGKRDAQSVKGEKDAKCDSRGDDNKEAKYDRENYGDLKSDAKVEKESYIAASSHLNWKESKDYPRGKRSSEPPAGTDPWSRGSSQGLVEVGKDCSVKDRSVTEERDYMETQEAVGENRVDSKGEDRFKEKDRKRKDSKHRDWGDRDKERSDRRSSMQVGNISSDCKESTREERESEKWERDKKDLFKDKERQKEREKDHIKRESWNGAEKEGMGMHNEKELGEGSVKVPPLEQENLVSEQKKPKELDSWKNVDREAKDRRREREVDMEGDRPEKRSRCYDKESDDGCGDGEGVTEREREAFNYGVQQRKRMLRPRSSPQVGNREPRFRSRAQDNEGYSSLFLFVPDFKHIWF
ncbi:hypothetical protein Pint_25590 [Pistacia integerrima]|uniref:Uncharacterized protein n=1 Tax=Pistacia integerrima TaxID=434235 RepID=A0ACC0YCX2_9ROSI|nr:hypothetical protein Pint_25590 [Pistacia integerrima]